MYASRSSSLLDEMCRYIVIDVVLFNIKVFNIYFGEKFTNTLDNISDSTHGIFLNGMI